MIDYHSFGEMTKGLESSLHENVTNFLCQTSFVSFPVYFARRLLKLSVTSPPEIKLVTSTVVALMYLYSGSEGTFGTFAGVYCGMSLGEFLSKKF